MVLFYFVWALIFQLFFMREQKLRTSGLID